MEVAYIFYKTLFVFITVAMFFPFTNIIIIPMRIITFTIKDLC